MSAYIIRRLVMSVFVIILVTITIFFALRLLPGDPIFVFYNSRQIQNLTDEQITAIRHEHGLDKPIVIQYFTWMGGLLRGDLGKSITYNVPVSNAIGQRLPISFHIGILGFIVGFVIGIPAGIISSIRRNTWLDTTVTTLANIGITIPVFWLGIMLIYVFALYFKVLPVMGYTSPFDDFWTSTKQLIMPVFCLSIFPIAGTARQTRSIMLEVLKQDYIRTAWSKGLGERSVIIAHALKNCFIPILTLQGMFIGAIVGGEILTEMVFNIPGMGRLLIDSIFKLDYAYVQGIVLIVALVVVLTNLIIDISYGWFDPRIRYS
jgi:peptide/nickel transport system permease protein